MARPSKYPREHKERAVRLVTESEDDNPTEFEEIRVNTAKLGIGSTETVRRWCGALRSMAAPTRGDARLDRFGDTTPKGPTG